MNKRHEWVMNPKDSKTVSGLTSLGFAWYLGTTPAAALVNLSQTAIVTFPVLAARFGVGKAFSACRPGWALRCARDGRHHRQPQCGRTCGVPRLAHVGRDRQVPGTQPGWPVGNGHPRL
ncbi:hypothetical protein [Stenotrophomonas sp. NRRL B-14846]|uniref:hypothetical protein n=1 Tax=Stenotrophomonas sp. NRRL B-14846 TaxID=3162882 RepID=UPI003D2C3F55